MFVKFVILEAQIMARGVATVGHLICQSQSCTGFGPHPFFAD